MDTFLSQWTAAFRTRFWSCIAIGSATRLQENLSLDIVTNEQICFVRIVIVSIVSVIYCFRSAVIILFVDLELSRIKTYFYISVVFGKTFFLSN